MLLAIANVSQGRLQQVAVIVEHGALPVFVAMLAYHDTHLVTVALDALKHTLFAERYRDASDEAGTPWLDQVEDSGGRGHLETLRTHATDAVRSRVVRRTVLRLALCTLSSACTSCHRGPGCVLLAPIG